MLCEIDQNLSDFFTVVDEDEMLLCLSVGEDGYLLISFMELFFWEETVIDSAVVAGLFEEHLLEGGEVMLGEGAYFEAIEVEGIETVFFSFALGKLCAEFEDVREG